MTVLLFNAPPCCDDKEYNNNDLQNYEYRGPVYNEETGMLEYN